MQNLGLLMLSLALLAACGLKTPLIPPEPTEPPAPASQATAHKIIHPTPAS